MTGRLKTKNYTERALAGATIPSFCYVPRNLRPGTGKMNISITNAEIIDNHKRIAEADPLGWIIAVMNGQPIPHFVIDKTSGQDELKLTYYLPQIAERKEAAQWLASRVTFKTPTAYHNPRDNAMKQHSADYNALIEERANEGV